MAKLRNGNLNSCKQCLFWNPIVNKNIGQCQRFPPILIQSFPGCHLLEKGALGVFPETESETFCGEFKTSLSTT